MHGPSGWPHSSISSLAWSGLISSKNSGLPCARATPAGHNVPGSASCWCSLATRITPGRAITPAFRTWLSRRPCEQIPVDQSAFQHVVSQGADGAICTSGSMRFPGSEKGPGRETSWTGRTPAPGLRTRPLPQAGARRQTRRTARTCAARPGTSRCSGSRSRTPSPPSPRPGGPRSGQGRTRRLPGGATNGGGPASAGTTPKPSGSPPAEHQPTALLPGR